VKLSKMVEENITAEEAEIIEEKCNKKKNTPMMEDGMVNCADCGTEYSSEEEKCPTCQSTKVMPKVKESAEVEDGKVEVETPAQEKEEMNESLIIETEEDAQAKELAWLKSLMGN